MDKIFWEENKTMKKIFTIFVAVMALFLAVSCGPKENTDKKVYYYDAIPDTLTADSY